MVEEPRKLPEKKKKKHTYSMVHWKNVTGPKKQAQSEKKRNTKQKLGFFFPSGQNLLQGFLKPVISFFTLSFLAIRFLADILHFSPRTWVNWMRFKECSNRDGPTFFHFASFLPSLPSPLSSFLFLLL